jgi:hypothetical protein
MRTSLHFAAAMAAIGITLAPVAAGQDKAAPKVLHPQITSAAWFQPDPLCATPLGCGFIPLPALSPYPKGTFHIGTAVGRQIARAFIGVQLGKATDVRGGTLSIPLDTSTTDGSVNPQAAKVNVCVTYQAVTDLEGAFDGAPSANCLPAAHAVYVAKPVPHLSANLKRISSNLVGARGLALVPADAAPTTAWQLAFKLPTATTPAAQRPAMTLLVGAVHQATHGAGSHPSAVHHGSGSGQGSNNGDGVGALGSAPTLPPAVSVVTPAETKPVIAPATTRAGRFVDVGYQYPELWLLPIALLVLIPLTVRALTRDLTRRR